MRARNKKTRDLDRLLQNWDRYRTLVIGSLAASKVSPRQENRFLELKAELAEQIQTLDANVPRSMAYESKRHFEAMAELLKRHVTLQNRDMGARWEPDDFLNTWHEYFIFLNRLRGTELGSGEGNPSRSPTPAAPAGGSGSRVWGHVGWTLAFGALGLVLFLLVSAFGVSRGPTGSLTFSAPATLHDAIQNASGALGVITSGVEYLFDPVIAAYGLSWTLALLAAAIGLFALFVRARG